MTRLPSLATALVLVLSTPAFAEGPPAHPHHGPPPSITVSGTGSVDAVPDAAVLTAGVETRADEAAGAVRANTEAMTRVIAALKEAGVDDKDVQTANFSINPVWAQDGDGGQPPRIAGYQASNQVRLTVRDLTRIGTLLDALVSAGANAAGGLEFVVKDARVREREALKDAVEDARARAETLAAAGGFALGPVLTVTESSQGYAPPYPMVRSMMADKAVPIAAGQQTLSATVQVTFAIR